MLLKEKDDDLGVYRAVLLQAGIRLTGKREKQLLVLASLLSHSLRKAGCSSRPQVLAGVSLSYGTATGMPRKHGLKEHSSQRGQVESQRIVCG